MVARESWEIGFKAAQSHYYARQQAERIGYPLTHMVTINFASTKIEPRDAVKAFARLRRDRFSKWAMRPRKGHGPAVPATYSFAFENVRDKTAFLTMEPGEDHNVHVHWLVHIPASRLFDFEAQIWEWVEEVTGGIVGGAETIAVDPIPENLRSYLAKGANKIALKLYGRGRVEPEPQGIIIGRRMDTSRNIGPAVRRAWDQKLGIKRRLPSGPARYISREAVPQARQA